MGHAKSLKERIKIREKAVEFKGRFFFETRHHDLFEFKIPDTMQQFVVWLKNQDDIELIEIEENRMAVKYKDKK